MLKVENGRVSVGDLEKFCVQAMLNAGMREQDARTTAQVLVTTVSPSRPAIRGAS